MFIQTDRLIIRDIEITDAAPFSNMASDGSLHEDIGFDAECGSWINEWIIEARHLAEDNNPTADYLAYAIELKETHEVIGSVGCSYYKDLEKVGITYFIGAQYRNHGYAAEAIQAYAQNFLTQYAQDELIATIREDNTPSWKAIEKAGFLLTAQRLYQDINDEAALLYRFYSYQKDI